MDSLRDCGIDSGNSILRNVKLHANNSQCEGNDIYHRVSAKLSCEIHTFNI